MPTRQYVGARYVPKFANPIQWDSNNIYEPLEMVTYLNNTYTSKKPVPQGVDITNTEYWVLSGNYNAQVEQYRQETVKLSNDVNAMKDTVKVTADTIGFTLNNVICVGDSYLQGYTHAGNVKSWGAILQEYALLSNSKSVFRFAAEGGAGFSTNGQQGHNYQQLLLNLAGGMTSEEKLAVETVIMLGGLNDVMQGNVPDPTSAINAARTAFPNARIVYGMSPSFQRYTMDKYFPMIQMHYDAICLTDIQYIFVAGTGPWNSGDNMHPSSAGQTAIAQYIISIMHGESAPKWFAQNITTFENSNNITILRWYYGSQNKLWITGNIPQNAQLEGNVYVLAKGNDIPIDMKYGGQVELILDRDCILVYSESAAAGGLLGIAVPDVTAERRINAMITVPLV